VGILVFVSIHFAYDISENIAVISKDHTRVFSLPGKYFLWVSTDPKQHF